MSLEVYNERLSFVNVGLKSIVFVVAFLLPLIAHVRPAGSEEPVAPGKEQGLSSYLQSIASTDPAIQEDSLKALAEMVDPAAFPLLDALNDGSLYIWKNASGDQKVVILKKV